MYRVLYESSFTHIVPFRERLKTTTLGKCTPEGDPMDSVFKEFSESYNQANKNWGESASEEVTRLHQLPLRKLFKKLDLYTC